MKRNSFLIRFIDIGLILLFGFIVISDITVRSQIELPGSEPGDPQEDRKPHMLAITVTENSTFGLFDSENETEIGTYEQIGQLENGLRSYAGQLRREGKTAVALIELDDATRMQTFIDVMDVCDRLGIAKNVNEETLRL